MTDPTAYARFRINALLGLLHNANARAIENCTALTLSDAEFQVLVEHLEALHLLASEPQLAGVRVVANI